MPDVQFLAARMFGVGFHTTSVPAEIDSLLARGVSSVILFSRNVQHPSQVRNLCADLKTRAARPLMIGIDQEGGRVRRLREGFTEIPSMRAVGKANDPQLAREIGGVLARELRAVNIDLDFAPTLDVDTNPNNPVIADRSLGASPQLVATLGCALIEGLQTNGVAACGKHFPGHGDTNIDSHKDLPRMKHDMERLNRIELLPFEAAVKCGVAMIMTAHVIFEPIDPKYPSTMSHAVMQGILRDRMGFGGVIVSDDLEMKAIASYFKTEEVIIRCVNAGVDLLMICHNHKLQHQAIDLLTQAVSRGDVPLARLEESNRRLDALMSQYVRPPTRENLSILASPEHKAIAQRVKELATQRSPDPTETWR
jgi:beta-N-acetylhexosaminidase